MSQSPARPANLLRSGALLFVTKAAPALAVLAVFIGYSRALPEADYGRYMAVWVRLGIVGTLAYAGIPLLLLSIPAGQVKQWALTSGARRIGIGAAWLLIFSGIFAWIQWKDSEVAPLLSAALVVLYAGASSLESALIVSGQQRALGWGGIAYAVGYAALHWFALQGTYSLNVLLTYIVALQATRLLWYAWLTWHSYQKVKAEPLPDPTQTRRYWLHSGLYDLSVNIARWADKAAVSFLLTAAVSAVYFNGSLEVPFIPLVMGAAGSAMLVELAKKDLSAGDAARLVRNMARMQTAVVLPVFFFLLFFREEIFAALFAGKYAASVPVFAASLLVLPLRAYHFTVLLEARQEGRIINTGALLDITLTLALFYPLYKIMGLPGVALAPVLSTWVQMGYYLFKTARVYGVRAAELFPLKHWLGYAAVFGGALWAARAIGASLTNTQTRLFLGAGIAVASGAGLLLYEIRRYKKEYGQDRTQSSGER